MAEKDILINTLEAEKAVLAAILESNIARDELISALEEDDFADPRNKAIFRAMYNFGCGN